MTNSLSNHKPCHLRFAVVRFEGDRVFSYLKSQEIPDFSLSLLQKFVPLSDSEIIIENNDDFVGDVEFVFVSVVPFEIVVEIVVVVVVGYAYRRLREAA